MNVVYDIRVSEASQDVLSSAGFAPEYICETEWVLVYLLLFFKYRELDRLDSILSGVSVYNYKQVGPGRLAQSLIGAFRITNLFLEIRFEKSTVKLLNK